MQTLVQFVNAAVQRNERVLHALRKRVVGVLLNEAVDAALQTLVVLLQLVDLLEARSDGLDAVLQHVQGAHQVVELLLLLHSTGVLRNTQLLEEHFIPLRDVVGLGHVLLALLLVHLLVVFALLQKTNTTNQLGNALSLTALQETHEKGDVDDVRLEETRLVQGEGVIVGQHLSVHFQHEQVGILVRKRLQGESVERSIQKPHVAIRQE